MGLWRMLFGSLNQPPCPGPVRQRRRPRRHTTGNRLAAGIGLAQRRRKARRNPAQRRPRFPRFADTTRRSIVVYHGTPSKENAKSIIKDGFMVGTGNVLGDGIYLARRREVAKTYAGASGVYIRCLVHLGRTCCFDQGMRQRYAAWCSQRGVSQDNSAITAFLIQHGYDTIQDGDTIVVLSPGYRNPTAWKRKNRHIRVLGVHRATDDQRIRV